MSGMSTASGDAMNPADRGRDPAVMARVRAIAGEVLARHGASLDAARRAGGWSNLTWLTGEMAIRVAAEPGPADLLREARLVALLPPEVGYPRIVESGVADRYEWVLAEQAPGTNLGEVWPGLGWAERARALVELWAKIRAVHGVDVVAAAQHARAVSPFYAESHAAATAQVNHIEARGVLTGAQAAELRARLDRFWPALPTGQPVLSHGDVSIENALWHDGHVSSLLDFEFAVLAPAELDANEMLREAYAPSDSDRLPDPDGTGRRRLREAVTLAVLPALREPGAADRLLGYAVLLHLWSTTRWLAEQHDPENGTGWQPHRALTALADGAGGYLAPVLAQLD